MEPYNNVGDITYLSELILDIKDVKDQFAQTTYGHLRSVSCGLIK